MIGENGKSSVTVKKSELLQKMQQNRKAHHDEYLRTEAVFRQKAIVELGKMLQEAQDGKPVRLIASLTAPFEMVDEYDRVIAMLEMSVSETVTISEQQFSNYVLDKWQWKASFLSNSSMYSGG